MDSARLECWGKNYGFRSQHARPEDSELTARKHAQNHGEWRGVYQPETQQPLAHSAELDRLPATNFNRDEGVDRRRCSLELLPDPSLVETIGEFNTKVEKYARQGSTYRGPRPSLELRYPPDRTEESCYTSSGPRHSRPRHHCLTIEVSKELHLPDRTTRPITDRDLIDIAGAIAHTQPWPGGHFNPAGLRTLEARMMDTLDHNYLHCDKGSNYTFARNTDSRTGRSVVVATKKAPDRRGDTYSVKLGFFQESSLPSAHPQTSSRVPSSSQLNTSAHNTTPTADLY
jgi:hypothetical protein